MKQRVKEYVDRIVVERDYDRQYHIFDEMLKCLIPYAVENYDNCRDIIQTSLGQMERIPTTCITYFFANFRPLISSLKIKKGKTPFLDYLNVDYEGDVTDLLDRVGPYIAGKQIVCDLHMVIADVLTLKERRFLASSATNFVQSSGVKSQWTNDIFQTAFIFCKILYPICKKDNVLELLFHTYNNVIDRLNTSSLNQDARDFAEGVFVVGYNEGMVADAYMSACRAYIGANNLIAGCFFYYICLFELNRTGREISERYVYDICWQYLKICRLQGIFPQEDIENVETLFNTLDTSDFDKMSFYHTLFSLELMAGEKKCIVREVNNFLDEHREMFFCGLNHGAMPWISLITSMQEILPNEDYTGIMPYVTAAKQVAYRDGNEMLFDIIEEKNLAYRLKELQYKLSGTRSRTDYSMDNRLAMIIAKKLLEQSYRNRDVSGFLLAMSPKTDFSIVMPIKETDEMYRPFEIDDTKGEELSSVYESPDFLTKLFAVNDFDVIVWIGKGKMSYLQMDFVGGEFHMAGELMVSQKDIESAIEKIIWDQHYEKEVKESGKSVYVKSNYELEEEGNQLYQALSHFVIYFPKNTQRVLYIKDLEIAPYPHQLFVSIEQCFSGMQMPTCNVMSIEVLSKTNTLTSLSKNFTKSFWIPYGGEEFTFDVIFGKLEDEINKHHIKVQNQLNPQNPIAGDLVLLCAHGGDEISSSEVFYVNDRPLLDTLESIGTGKIAILLICYSGTISQSHYDNAMHTLVKKLIQKGYCSVVAPMWSLPTVIITPWISVFMNSMEEGDYIIDAVYKANMVVKQDFVAPSAWACLHLFGNPYVCISNQPRVKIDG